MEASKACCPPGETHGKSCCKCAPGWTCVIKKIDEPEVLTSGEHFTKCSDTCVCITDESTKVESEGGFCVCGEGYSCSFVKTEGPDAGKVFLSAATAAGVRFLPPAMRLLCSKKKPKKFIIVDVITIILIC